MIHVDNLSKTFKVHKKTPGLRGSVRALFRREQVTKEAVREVSFDVAEGEIVGVVGANGAGKTTLVKMLAGIIHPSSGDAQVLGHRPWERRNEFRRQIALIMGQKAQLWWDLPAADCFLLLKEIYRLPEQAYHESLDELTTTLGIEDLLHIQIRRLSLGERMKMELVAALLHRPRVVYLDEPTIGLDLTAQRAIRKFLLKYRSEREPAMLLTSHYMEDIAQLCKRILVIREGELVYDGDLQTVVRKHAPHKVLTARVPNDFRDRFGPEQVADLGDAHWADDGQLKIHVLRTDVAQAASAFLDRVPASDLSIEEPDIGSIIESILAAKSDP